MKRSAAGGFTLIELSIVLVIIGLIVGGVLFGQDLINAAKVRAQIAQIEKYQTAVNTFRGKYGYLPGDIPDPAASNYGFTARGTAQGQGDGNGVLEGRNPAFAYGGYSIGGESGMFWVDLSKANLLDGGIDPAGYAGGAWLNTFAQNPAANTVNQYLPAARSGNGNYVYVWSGGYLDAWGRSDNINYFSVAKVWGIQNGLVEADMGLTVQQAYSIDAKIDDGLPQSGRVTTIFMNLFGWLWSSKLANSSSPGNMGLSDSGFGPVTNLGSLFGTDSGSATTCYDKQSPSSLPVTYSMGGNASPNNTNLINCALSFRFQ